MSFLSSLATLVQFLEIVVTKACRIRTSRWTRPRHSLSIAKFRIETVNAYQYRIYEFDFCSYNFHIFRSSRFGKEEVDVYRLMSNNCSDHYVLFYHNPLSHLTIDASSCMKLQMNHWVKYITINRMCRSITIFQIPQ